MTLYRPFRNGDPPQLARLWNAAGLGRGAVAGVTVELLDHLLFSQQHFRRESVVVAEAGGEVVGAALLGFGPGDGGEHCDRTRGVVSAVLVHPDHRGRGIGRECVRRAVERLRTDGAVTVTAGPAPPADPFLVGLYGGSEPAGFLESDPAAAGLMAACGFSPVRRRVVLHRDAAEPCRTGFQTLAARRKCDLRVREAGEGASWWWATRHGRLDTLRFTLSPKMPRAAGPPEPAATVTLSGLDLYAPRWGVRAVGLHGLTWSAAGSPAHAQALLTEVLRRLREQAVDLAEVHADSDDVERLALLDRLGFREVDAGVVYAPVEA